ncbi:MAG: hypothetical protein WD872_15535 [Pirellulaceae bacterium]
MLTPATKPQPTLIHHPSAVLDSYCTFDLANQAWLEFDEKLSAQLSAWEEQNRGLWTSKAVRESLGR